MKIRENIKLATKYGGKGWTRQILDLLPIILRRYNIGISDYYEYGLHCVPKNRWRDFLGWRYETDISLVLNERNGVQAGWDKVHFHEVMEKHGFPTVPLKAVYKNGGGVSLDCEILSDESSLHAFLSSNAIQNTYVKAAYSQQGKDSLVITDVTSEGLMLSTGTCQSVEDLMEQINRSDDGYFRRNCGWIFQMVITSHPDIVDVTGSEYVSGLRLVTLNVDNTPKLVKALFKINGGRTHVDNFFGGRYGNLLSRVEIETGIACEPVCGFWQDTQDYAPSEVFLDGFSLPYWNETVEVVCAASALFPLMRLQHWDVAITKNGPVLLELNDMGATRFHQVHGAGFVTDDMRGAIRAMVGKRYYPWVNAHKKWIDRL